jgi:glycogen debranching enzyme
MKVEIPKHSLHASEAESLRTPKTPQNEGISWFESDAHHGPVRVYELALEADGGPNKDRAVSGTCPY